MESYTLPNGKHRPALPPLDLKQRYTPAEAALYLRQSISKTYKDIKAGRLEAIEDGKMYVPGRVIAAKSGATK